MPTKKNKPDQLTRFESEVRLQQLTKEMTDGWAAQQWGNQSTGNFAKFCRWLLKELRRLPRQ